MATRPTSESTTICQRLRVCWMSQMRSGSEAMHSEGLKLEATIRLRIVSVAAKAAKVTTQPVRWETLTRSPRSCAVRVATQPRAKRAQTTISSGSGLVPIWESLR